MLRAFSPNMTLRAISECTWRGEPRSVASWRLFLSVDRHDLYQRYSRSRKSFELLRRGSLPHWERENPPSGPSPVSESSLVAARSEKVQLVARRGAHSVSKTSLGIVTHYPHLFFPSSDRTSVEMR